MESIGKSVTGLIRANNEDCIYVGDDKDKIYIVADGMGGHNGGETASALAVESFLKYVKENKLHGNDAYDVLVGGIAFANDYVYKKSIENPDLNGMGTTFTCLYIDEEKMAIAHVGDSRAYVLRANKLLQLTKDHTYVMEMVRQGKITPKEAEIHPRRNVITRAVGTAETVETDLIIETMEKDDIILLCSDGLSAMVKDKAIEEVLIQKTGLELKAERLIELANESGGRDNISLIIVRHEVKA